MYFFPPGPYGRDPRNPPIRPWEWATVGALLLLALFLSFLAR